MFGKKSKEIKRLNEKIDCYVAREYKNRDKLVEKDNRINELNENQKNLNSKLNKLTEKLEKKDNKICELRKLLQDSKKERVEVKTLEEIRIESKLTKQQVANKLGISSTYYLAQVEKGLKNPTLDYIQRLADIYHVTPAQIVESLTIDVREVKYDRK